MIEPDVKPVHDDLVRSGVLAPVELGGSEERLWLDCDLASFAENRLGEVHDPRDLDDARRAEWLVRAVDERPVTLARRSRHERCYWLLDEGRHAGTMALANATLGSERLRMASFYVLPPYRRRGIGRRAMSSLMDTLGKNDLSLRLETSWCWQRTVKFYLKLGLWVYMWKRDLDLFWNPHTPPPHIEVGEDAALSVALGDCPLILARARRRGDTLELDEPPSELAKEERIGEAYWHATSTLALALALQGWPLVRSPSHWERYYYADAGPPEALAYKIGIWEARDRKHGRIVATPHIPGIEYPTWDELQARWDAEERSMEEKSSR